MTRSLLSETISFLRFPLIIGVVLIHANLSNVIIGGTTCISNVDYPIYTYISYLLSSIIARVSVPLFFFISGFLFFYKVQIFDSSVYLHKMKKRIHTILLPYIIWNCFIILFYYCAQSIFPGLLSGNRKLICDYSLSDCFLAFWDTDLINGTSGGGDPIDYPLWFVRDLMVVMALSPFVYYIIQKLKKIAISVLGVLWFFGYWFHITGFSIDALFFFAFGAYFSINKKDFVNILKPYAIPAIIIYLLIMVTVLFCHQTGIIKEYIGYIHKIGILVGLITMITVSAHFISQGKWKSNQFLDKSTFFIYAYHAMPLSFIVKLLLKYVKPYTEVSLLAIYFSSTIVIVLIGLLIYHLLRTYLPNFTAVITGGR